MPEERESNERKSIGRSVRLFLYAVLLLFNIYHVATEQIARANKEEIQSLRAEFAELRQELSRQNREFMEQSFQREKAKTDFDLFYEHYLKTKKPMD